jgi:hypothetical protein
VVVDVVVDVVVEVGVSRTGDGVIMTVKADVVVGGMIQEVLVS